MGYIPLQLVLVSILPAIHTISNIYNIFSDLDMSGSSDVKEIAVEFTFSVTGKEA